MKDLFVRARGQDPMALPALPTICCVMASFAQSISHLRTHDSIISWLFAAYFVLAGCGPHALAAQLFRDFPKPLRTEDTKFRERMLLDWHRKQSFTAPDISCRQTRKRSRKKKARNNQHDSSTPSSFRALPSTLGTKVRRRSPSIKMLYSALHASRHNGHLQPASCPTDITDTLEFYTVHPTACHSEGLKLPDRARGNYRR